MKAAFAAVLYALAFFGLAAADYATTQIGLAQGDGRELNDIVEDAGGGLSARYIVLNILLGLICAGFFASAVRGMAHLREDAVNQSWRTFLYLGERTAGASAYQLFYFLLVILVMRAIAVVSNSVAIMGGVGLPGVVDRATGRTLADPLLLTLTITITVLFAMVVTAPIARVWARQRVRS